MTGASPLRILLVGANGQLGSELRRDLAPLGRVIATGREQLDISDLASIRRGIGEIRPDVIVNAAAYTAVDRAESEPKLAELINTTAPGVMAEEAVRTGATLVHFSTDFVFDGKQEIPYVESDAAHPLNVYGRTKLGGESAILATDAQAYVFRIGWVYSRHHTNFLTTVRKLAAERDVLTIVADQVGVPTCAGVVSAAVAQLLPKLTSNRGERSGGDDSIGSPGVYQPGVYHMSGGGCASWAEFAAEVLRLSPVPGREHVVVAPIATTQFPRPATRPAYSVMDSTRLAGTFGIRLPAWRDQLHHCLEAPES